MNLTTRCPACGTTFKVVREQLRISDGWVRCGRCSEVFDGNEALHDAGPENEAPAAVPLDTTFDFPDSSAFPGASTPGSNVDTANTANTANTAARGPESSVDEPTDDAGAPAVAADAEPAPAPWLGQWPSLDLQPEAPKVAPPAAAAAAPAEKPFDVVLASALAEPAASLAEPSESGTSPDNGGFASLERRDGSVMRWLRRLPGLSRLPLRTISAGALVLLAAQSIYHSRDAIAARQPALQPALAAMCSVGGCSVSPLRRIDAITIDGASFAREQGGDGYRLTFAVRNAARFPLAMPSVEVTLLDTQERAVVRRVFMPAEFGAPEVLPADTTRSVALSLALSDASALPPVVGYGVAAFYP